MGQIRKKRQDLPKQIEFLEAKPLFPVFLVVFLMCGGGSVLPKLSSPLVGSLTAKPGLAISVGKETCRKKERPPQLLSAHWFGPWCVQGPSQLLSHHLKYKLHSGISEK